MIRLTRLSQEAWVFIALMIISAVVLFKYVNLVPRVDNNFFFSNHDPEFQDEKKISHLFKRRDSLLIINASGDVKSKTYQNNVQDLSLGLSRLGGVTGVKSITMGPSSLQDAFNGPLWKRLLIARDKKSTNIIVLLNASYSQKAIPAIVRLVNRYSADDFYLVMSGPPYIVELISRHLLKDIRVFSLLVLVIFGLITLFIFRSPGIVLGAVVSCVSASMWTLMITHMFGIKIGLLTANLATIVFVITLSHIIFFTYNWKFVLSHEDHASPVEEAMRLTFSPSFWSMTTTLLGFLSLIFVPAQPLKELGAGGITGAVVAITVAYGIYPAFLRLVPGAISKDNMLDRYQEKIGRFLERQRNRTVVIIFILFCAALPGAWRANTDPSLFSFFQAGSPLEKSLVYIDHHGGSSPLILVIKSLSGEKLDTVPSYRKLWALQKDLESYDQVGSVISLPVLIAEAKRPLLASLLSYKSLLDILKYPQFSGIARSFITDDHRQGLFLLRMKESQPRTSRLDVIRQIKKIVRSDGFELSLVGGIYCLQGHLSQLVASSIVFGLGQLILIFSIIALVVSRSFKIALAISLSICVIPVIVLGVIGWLRVPLDVISAPACNIALGLGIDSMIHMVRAYRRQKYPEGKNTEAWDRIRHRFWQPVLTFTLVMVLGFGIF
ncbi:MAG: MMPL family transporter, partial [Candidatus Omnitrophica bacterium]|nr:MMPL family transporter [Candidatus Omnitrophota bacterium]